VRPVVGIGSVEPPGVPAKSGATCKQLNNLGWYPGGHPYGVQYKYLRRTALATQLQQE